MPGHLSLFPGNWYVHICKFFLSNQSSTIEFTCEPIKLDLQNRYLISTSASSLKTARKPQHHRLWASNIFKLFKHCLSTETTLRQHWVEAGRIMQQFASFICFPRYLRFSADCVFFGLTRFKRRLKHHSFTLRTPWLNISKRLLKLFKTLFFEKKCM